jgi:hypothetical protein
MLRHYKPTTQVPKAALVQINVNFVYVPDNLSWTPKNFSKKKYIVTNLFIPSLKKSFLIKKNQIENQIFW